MLKDVLILIKVAEFPLEAGGRVFAVEKEAETQRDKGTCSQQCRKTAMGTRFKRRVPSAQRQPEAGPKQTQLQ